MSLRRRDPRDPLAPRHSELEVEEGDATCTRVKVVGGTYARNKKPLRNVGSGKANAERGKKEYRGFRAIDGIGVRALTKVFVYVSHSL